MKDHLRELLAQALLDLRRHGRLPADLALPEILLERSKTPEHGDYATNLALLLARPAGLKPRDLAQAILDTLPRSQHVAKVEIAGPGFLNFHISQACRLATLRRIFELGEAYGRGEPGSLE